MVRFASKLTLFSAALLLSCVVAESPDPTLPVSSLLASADALLARGDKHGALDHFDAAVQKDPSNYLTLFKRGATYLSLGRPSQASADFNAVLQLKPDFEAALLQRARLRAKGGDWDAARRDYTSAGRAKHAAAIEELDHARTAADAASQAELRGDWDACIEQAGTAILVAQAMPSMRSLRARCRMRKGNVPEAVGDLAHVAQLNPSSTDPHLQIANLLYFSLGDYDRSTAQLRKCLHSDPDSKPCSKLFRRIKTYEKQVAKARGLREKRQWNSANKILLGVGTAKGAADADADAGVIADVKADIDDLHRSDTLNEHCPQTLLAGLDEMVCDSFSEMGKPEKARPHCDETLRLNPQSIPAILGKATRLIKEELFEEAIRFLEKAKGGLAEGVADDHRITQKFQEAQTLLRRSKEKDYYKVLGVARDADAREIKKAYRRLTKKYHPDKYRGELKAEDIQTKMSAINEAYEVLSNPELRERFDHGDDPNSQERQNPFQQGGGGHPFAGFGGQQQQFMFRHQPGGGHPFGGSGGFNFHF